MKKVMYGTVSALALLLAAHGVASAQDAQTSTASVGNSTFVGFNNGGASPFFTNDVDVSNNIDDTAFTLAKGAFNVLQNQSINSAVQQGMAIAAVVNHTGTPASDNTASAGVGQSTNVLFNSAFNADINGNPALDAGENEIEANAFQNAKGAFNVLQNASINSNVQQGLSIAAIVNHGNDQFDDDPTHLTANAGVSQAATIFVNHGEHASIGSSLFGDRSAIEKGNSIENSAFSNAAGAFNVLQNESVNSSTQQGLSIAAVVSRTDQSDNSDDNDDTTANARAQNSQNAGVSANTSGNSILEALQGQNGIVDNAFSGAAGAFSVLQNQSINSSVQQAMSIAAVVNRESDGDGASELFDLPGQSALSTASLSAAVTGNSANVGPATFTDVASSNLIANNAFSHAAGAFNVLQNASVNSAVQQSMSISAVVNH